MAKTTGWSYVAGEKGRNRVRAYEDEKTGIIFLEFYERAFGGESRRQRISTKHRDRDKGKQQADDLASAIGKAEPPPQERPTLRTLIDIYLGEVTPGKSPGKQAHDRRAAAMFLRQLGADRDPSTLNRRDWDAFIRDRRSGRTRPEVVQHGRGKRKLPQRVADRQVEYDLKFLLAVLNWAVSAGDGKGGYLLERNPLKGLKIPRNENPNRPVLYEDEYQAMLAVADEVHPLCRLLFVLLNETGHRGIAVRHLRWSDVDLDAERVIWRAEHDKQRKEHSTVLSPEAVAELRQARRKHLAVGHAWLFPSSRVPEHPIRRETADQWFKAAVAKAGVRPRHGLGPHSFKRKAATELDGAPMHTVSEILGTSAATLMKVYQRPNEQRQREALARRSPLLRSGTG